MANKITKREVINSMLANEVIASNEMYVAYLQNELKLLDKKAEKKGKSAEELAELNALRENVLNAITNLKRGTVTELQLSDENISVTKYSNQKITSVLRDLKASGLVDRVTEKGKTIYFLVQSNNEWWGQSPPTQKGG